MKPIALVAALSARGLSVVQRTRERGAYTTPLPGFGGSRGSARGPAPGAPAKGRSMADWSGVVTIEVMGKGENRLEAAENMVEFLESHDIRVVTRPIVMRADDLMTPKHLNKLLHSNTL